FFPLHTPPPTSLYTLSLHDALPIYLLPIEPLFVQRGEDVPIPNEGDAGVVGVGDAEDEDRRFSVRRPWPRRSARREWEYGSARRSEEHTSELQSRGHLVCRLLLEKK